MARQTVQLCTSPTVSVVPVGSECWALGWHAESLAIQENTGFGSAEARVCHEARFGGVETNAQPAGKPSWHCTGLTSLCPTVSSVGKAANRERSQAIVHATELQDGASSPGRKDMATPSWTSVHDYTSRAMVSRRGDTRKSRESKRPASSNVFALLIG